MELMQKIEDLLKEKMNTTRVHVGDLTGTGDHLDLTIVSSEFEGLSLIKQHQKVMDVLKTEFDKELHAVKIKTITPDQDNK